MADNESVVGFYPMILFFAEFCRCVTGPNHHYNLTYYTTYVPGGRGSFIPPMSFLITICHVCFFAFFVDLIDTTASVRDPSCLLCFLFMFAFLFPLLSRSSEPGRSAHLSPYLLSSF